MVDNILKAYLINLDRSQDRLQRMYQQFEKAGLAFERVAAVDGKTLSDDEIASIKRNAGWKEPLNRSELGCFLSHRKCLEQIVESGEQYAAVFEDDVKFSGSAKQFFQSDAWIPSDADIIKLETHGRKVLMDKPVTLVAGEYSVARLYSQNILAAGYIISAKYAASLLARMNDAAAPMDHLLFTPACGFFNEMRIYQVSPVICEQAGLESTLSGDRAKEHQSPPVWKKVIREIIRPFLRLKTAIWGMYINRFTSQRWGLVEPLVE